jgi:hypothetical protein
MTAAAAKGAILDPGTHSKGGAVPDGDYTIKSVTCEMFDYGGTVEAGPALCFVFEADGQTHEQYYSAGKAERLIPSDDKKRMVHPRGEAATWSQGSNASQILASLMKAGFPHERLTGDDVTVFNGTKITLTAVAQQKRGLANEKEGKVISLVTKVISLPGVKAGAARPPLRPATAPAAAATSTAPPTAAAPAVASTNGDLEGTAIQAVMQALDAAPDHKLKVKGLAVRCLKFAAGTKLNDLTKLITADWLQAQSDATGWVTDGEEITI